MDLKRLLRIRVVNDAGYGARATDIGESIAHEREL
jgi:hypothetical protein